MRTVEQAESSVQLDSSGFPKRLESRRLILQARSLANVLNVVRRRLAQLQSEHTHTKEDLQHYKNVLDDIDGRWRDEEGTFAGKLAPADPKTASLCSRLFNECFDMLEAMEHTAAEMPPELRDIHKQLVAMQGQLAALKADPDHTLADVLPLQQKLDEIDADRLSKGGSFATGMEAAPGEYVCNEVLNHCYELLQECLRNAEDISPEMKGVYDALRSVKNTLRRLMGKRHHTVEDLRHFQGIVERIDADRKDGVFCGNLEQDLIEKLADGAEDMSPAMKAIHAQLEQYRHELEGMLHRQRTTQELKDLQNKLDVIDDERQAHAGIFAHRTSQEGKPPPGQAVCSALLNHCYRLLHDLYVDAAAAEGQTEQ